MAYKSDEDLQSEVRFQLGWDSRVKQTEVGATVHKGVVRLTGVVDSYSKKLAAQEAAHRAPGALDVVNEIEVCVPNSLQHSDEEIARAVRHALEWSVMIPAADIYSTVSGGWVTLTGDVTYYRERVDAESIVSQLSGVRGVINAIRVCMAVEPERIKFLIEDVLERRAGREACRIRVRVEAGEVTLTGAVNSWDEKNAILGAISHAPGVTALHDHLVIDPYTVRFEGARIP